MFHRFIQGLFLISVLMIIAACQSKQEDNTISFSIFGDPAELAAYEDLVAAFSEAHPEITVQLQHIPGQSDYRQRLAADFSSGEPPDVILLNYRRFATFAEQGGLEPLGSYLANSDLIQESDFFQVAIDSFYMDGSLWCIPQNISSLVVYYNKDMFDAANVPYPTNDWTHEDFLAAARALTRDVDGDGRIDEYGASIDPSIFRLAPIIWQFGGQLVDDLDHPTRLMLDTPQATAAFQWFVDLQVKEHVVPDAVAESAEEGESRFLNGRLAMYFNSRRGVPTYRTITNFDWDVAPLPRGQQAASILHSDGYCMAQSTQNKEAAWTFIEFANSTAGQTIVAQSGRTVPSLIAVASSPAFLNPDLPPANSQIYIDTVPTLGRVPTMHTWVGIEETAGNEIERAFYGQATVQEAIESALTLTESFFDQVNTQN
ncbi:MAG: sugar ABC transporter substrate-binding protein [Ardenticatenaceae bacterium]|nr:sugar ABC transporter substrate-binding protein [Anaerolineales bacterium]MCB8921338.1 sugar ABC transporter substrate-binding protein [Ardenticatenaceae bacterium]MCB9004039.1 sugar ABC transporter substrate-binding protein [Ardenticatenaceae bacterium]